MSKILLRREDNPRIYNVVDKFSAKLGIKDIVVYERNSKPFSKQYTGQATSKGLVFPSVLIRDAQLYPHVFKFFAGHELIHFNHKEYGSKQAYSSTIATFCNFVKIKGPLHKDNAKVLLKEMRANIEGAVIAELSNSEIIDAQILAQNKNNDPLIPDSYKAGYPDRNMISNFCTKYKKFDESVARIILDDFCDKMHISKKEQFINKIVDDFFINTL
ncbi:hypothetical protein [Bacillus toyonensis]|uniref:hypothetical protein n=1 Tax=Bacillus toyonensis TaxID=155322 RepID=UPI00028AE3D3|nr:hypothetical protein [Bacillus toyonensis]AFU17648.1 hypothetical protein MC28_F204 [Bacillus thuringiensis MC28]PEO77485.1 hypothetical protein CN570_19135 [Bacillus toyonensis]